VRIYIVAASDAEQDEERRLRWGDYWFKESLGIALKDLGYEIVTNVTQAQTLINCHGMRIERLPEWTYNVLWVIGHPDAVTVDECNQYDAVFSESQKFAAHLREQGIDARWLPGASDFVPMDAPKTHKRIFVGNARGKSRPCIDALEGNYDGLEVWGEGWDWLPEGIWQGLYYPHEKLNELYASSETVLNDVHEDMARWGMYNPRYYDILAIAGRRVPTFRDCAERIMRSAYVLCGLDLGCGTRKRPGLTGIDRVGSEEIIAWDLESWLPGDLGPQDVIVADNILEHINNLIPLMNVCRKALLPNGRMHVRVPSATTAAAFQDPTHVRYFVPETFDYFDIAHNRWQEYGRTYGIKPWRILRRTMDGVMIEVLMRPAEDGAA